MLTASRLGIAGSFFCEQKCFKAGCMSLASFRFSQAVVINFRRGPSPLFFLSLRPFRSRGHTQPLFRKLINSSTTSQVVSGVFLWNPTVCLLFARSRDAEPRVYPLPDGSYNPFPSFDFTGSLRPAYPLSAKRLVPDNIPRPDYAEDGQSTLYYPRQNPNLTRSHQAFPEVKGKPWDSRLGS